jgi:tripartite-type tricarboxylate transporter receptor subunit TctC
VLSRRRRSWIVWVAGVLAGAARAQPPVLRIVSGFAPGGASSIVARAAADALQERLGRNTIVDPRPGADGTIAALHVAAAPADGSTLLLGSSTALVAVPALRRPPPYDPFVALAPVCRLGRFQMALLVPAAVPARSAAELLQAIEQRPEGYVAAASNSTAELALRQWLGGRRVVLVPYKGDAPALLDLVGGRVQMMVATGAAAAPYLKDGRLRALATTARDGGLVLDVDAWLGLFAPAGTPLPQRESLAAAVGAGFDDAALRQRLAPQGFEVQPLGPAPFEAYFRLQYRQFAAAAQRHGMTLER